METEELKKMSNAEINELCALKVMGWKRKTFNRVVKTWADDIGERTKNVDEWNPAEDMGDVWMIFEKLREKFPWVGIDTFAKGYRCLVIDDEKDTMDGIADTAPLAICKAALLVVME